MPPHGELAQLSALSSRATFSLSALDRRRDALVTRPSFGRALSTTMGMAPGAEPDNNGRSPAFLLQVLTCEDIIFRRRAVDNVVCWRVPRAHLFREAGYR